MPKTSQSDFAQEFVARARHGTVSKLDHSEALRIVYHADIDGACAAACLKFLAEERGQDRIKLVWIPTSEFHFQNILRDIPPSEETLNISVDINFTSRIGFISKLDELYGDRFIIIDDHVPNERPTLRSIQIINPNWRALTPTHDLASSLFSYLLCIQSNLKVPTWVAALGLYFDKQLSAYRTLFTHVPNTHEMEGVVRILSTPYLEEGVSQEVDPAITHLTSAIRRNASWQDFKHQVDRDGDLRLRMQQSQSAIELTLSACRGNGHIVGKYRHQDVMLYEFNSTYRITNIIASRLREEFDGITVALKVGSELSQFELRIPASVQGMDLVGMLRKVSKNVPLLNFGGHERAAGGSLQSADTVAFRQVLAALE